MTMLFKTRRQRFPMWQYLNQPLFHPEIKLILHPGRFWKEYRILHLTRCWDKQSEQKNRPHR